jgi:hypothetical protein
VSREYEPVVGQWYENIDEDETFRVISVDEDAELVEVEYEDGEVEELDLDTGAEFNLEKSVQPEGWAGADLDDDDDEDEDDEDWDDDDDDEDDDDFDDDDEEDADGY